MNKNIILFPIYPPEELIHSFGLNPIILWNLENKNSLTEANKHLENFTCRIARFLSEEILTTLDNNLCALGILSYNTCDVLRNLPEIIQKGLIDKGISNIPFINFHIPMTNLSTRLRKKYLQEEIKKLIRSFEKIYEVKYEFSKFKRSVELYRKYRTLLNNVETYIRGGCISFNELVIIQDSVLLKPVEDKIALVESKIQNLKNKFNKIDIQNKKKIILSGILPPSNKVVDIIENNDLIISTNDIAYLKRYYYYTPSKFRNVHEYYYDFYENHYPCPTLLYSTDKRVDFILKECLKYDIDGFIFLGEKFCEYEFFEIPYLKEKLKENNISILELEFSIDLNSQIESIKTRIEAFAELLHEK